MKLASWHLYIIETASGALYTGITTDVSLRLQRHQSGKGAKALRGKGPLLLRYQQLVGNHGRALQLEYQIKQLTRAQKILLVNQQPNCLLSWLSTVDLAK